MSAPTAIGAVTRSLRDLLDSEMSVSPDVPITMLAPDESDGARSLNLFLYRLEEHPELRNQDFRLRPSTSDELIPPPLSLRLHYLMTVYGPTDPDNGNSESHSILGDAMRVFHEFPVIPDANLQGDLPNAFEQIGIVHVPLDSEELSRLWGTFNEPFRLSVMYEVSVVQLDQLPGTPPTIPNRVREIGVPDIRAPFAPPRLTGISPESGAAGTLVTVSGEHLDGWRANVRMSGRIVATDVAITGDSFDFNVPNPFDPGFHQMRIDVSGLARDTFFFEVV